MRSLESLQIQSTWTRYLDRMKVLVSPHHLKTGLLSVTLSENQVFLWIQYINIATKYRKSVLESKVESTFPMYYRCLSNKTLLSSYKRLSSPDQLVRCFSRTDFTTNLKTATITLLSLFHKGRLQPEIFISVTEKPVIFTCQVFRMVTGKVLKQHAIPTLTLLLNLSFQHFVHWKVQLSIELLFLRHCAA